MTDFGQVGENLKSRASHGARRAVAVVLRAVGRAKWCILGLSLLWILSTPIALLSISAYQRFISPHKGWHCAYAALYGGPSCSGYGKETVSRHGVLKGMWLLWDRFGDCRAAVDILAANSVGDQAGRECAAACEKSEKDCAEGCVRGCCGGAPQHMPRGGPTRPNPPPRTPQPAASISDVSPREWAIYDATGTYPGNSKLLTVTWKSTGLPGNVNIDLARNQVTDRTPYRWERILSNVPNTGRAEWIPAGPATPFVRVRVQSADKASVSSVNGHYFCIYGAYYKGFPGGFCTEYAAAEFDKVAPKPGIDWHGVARDWYDSAAANQWETTTDPRRGVPGAIIVWAGGLGHVAVLRGYVQDDKGNITHVRLDEQNGRGKYMDRESGITTTFGQPKPDIISIADIDRTKDGLSFVGLILPTKR